jgi:hypothetical protein
MGYREADEAKSATLGPPVIGNETWEWDDNGRVYRVVAPSWFEARRLIRLQLENRRQFAQVVPMRVTE